MPSKSFTIDCFIEGKVRLPNKYAAVAVDVIRSSTVAVTAAESGRKCLFAPSVEKAVMLSKLFSNALLIGEEGGNMPYGFDLNNSPAAIETHKELARPAILVSSSGTPLFNQLKNCRHAYVACLQNFEATADYLAQHHDCIAIIGAPTRGEFREEDQVCCAWIGAHLMNARYLPENQKTLEIVNRWRDKSIEAIAQGKSAEYLRKSGQIEDLEYILKHVNDLNSVFAIKGQEIVKIC